MADTAATGLATTTLNLRAVRSCSVAVAGTSSATLIGGAIRPSHRSIYLAVIEAYDTDADSAETLYFSTGLGWVSRPSDTPANTYFEPRILQPAAIRRDMFAAGTTMGASRTGYGDLVLINEDGGLDYLLDYAFDGRAVTLYYGDDEGSFPASFTKVFVGTMEQAEVGTRSVTIKLRDRQAELDVPLQTTKYAGDNALPAGLEGVEDLLGKPKPLCYGDCRNVAPPCVNTSKLIYQVSDNALSSVSGVYDSGVRLGSGVSDLAIVTDGFISADGVTACCWVEWLSLFVAVGDGGEIRTSPDGETWTGQMSGTANGLRRVAENGSDLIVAAGAVGTIVTSPDAVNWTVQTSGLGASSVYSVAFGRDMWVVGGYSGETRSSPDGVTWTARTRPGGGSNPVRGAAFGAGRFVVSEEDLFWVSEDGITWTANLDPGGMGTIYRIQYVEGQFLATNGSGYIYKSPDGQTWTRIDTGIGVGYGSLLAMTYFEAGGGYIFGGQDDASGPILLWSEDLVTFEEFTSPFTHAPGYVRSIATGDGVLLIIMAGAGVMGQIARSEPVYAEYASEADLLDDDLAPLPGTAKVYLAGGYIRLGSIPAGLVTADVVQGAAAANRTAGQVWKELLERAGKVSNQDFSAADVVTLDAANDATVGLWTGTQDVRVSDALTAVAQSVGAWWGVDRLGIYRIKRLTDPSVETAAVTFVADDMVEPLERVPVNDVGRGLPTYRTILRYDRNYTVQDRDIAASVTAARRALLAQEWREYVKTNTAIQTEYLLAREAIYQTLLADSTDAATEGDRVQALRGVRRDLFRFAVPLDEETIPLDLGSYIGIVHTRFGLSVGRTFTIISLEPDAAKRILRLGVWG